MSPTEGKIRRTIFLGAAAVTLTLLAVQVASAAEAVSPERRLWDTIMMLVNFGILVFLFLRYARKPLMDYLHQIREKIDSELGIVRDHLERNQSARDAEAAKLESIEQHIQEIQESILEMARLEKEKIIEEGRKLADKMIRDAEAYAAYRMARAKKAVRDQMVDLAVAMAQDRLTEKMTEEDNKRIVERFIGDLASSSAPEKFK